MSLKRVQKEYKAIKQTTNPFQIELLHKIESNNKIDPNLFFKWKAVFCGPHGTPYSNGKYILNIDISKSHPFQPPKITFINPPYCVNVSGHNNYKQNIDKDDNKCDSFGEIKFELLADQWSPAYTIHQVLSKLYDFCFYECGFYKGNVVNMHSKYKIHLNKHKEYVMRPREFLFKISKYNEIYGNGNKAIYYELPQMNEMKYFENVSIIDNILRDKYKCNEIIIEIIFLFYGKKVNFCGLTNNKFNIPPFNGIEDNWADTENFQTEFEIRTKWRSYDEIQTDVNNVKKNGNTFKMMIKAPLGGGRTLYFDACGSLTIGDLKTIYNETEGFPKEKAVFICNGKQLDDTKLLSFYNIKEGSNVSAILRL
eukprot:320350_1